MKLGIVFFLAGSLFSGGLFQFDLGLPSYHSNHLKTQRAKISKASSKIKNKRNKLSKKAIKNAGKKAAGSLLPFVGTVVTLGLAAEDYCDDLEHIIEIQNILDNKEESYDLDSCLKEAESFITSSFD